MRSLLTLKALTYAPTGGIVAAATTSLPEEIGGQRNWDYRYCWLRDATFTLQALVKTGYTEEARAWREWLLRAIAGSPERLQILYGVAGERHAPERELPWLSGYEGSTPVRVGNGAVDQRQLDVYGEVMDTLWLRALLRPGPERGCLADPARPDDAGWRAAGRSRTRGSGRCAAAASTSPTPRCWRGSRPTARCAPSRSMAARRPGRPLPARCATRSTPTCAPRATTRDRQTFTQSYGSTALDAALLLIPQVGFLPPDDERVRGTLRAVQRELAVDGLVRRYDTDDTDDGVPGDEGAFLACSFWLADALVLDGQVDAGRVQFERLLALRNDVGLLAEEYDVHAGRQLGNLPQAYSHLALVNSALNLAQVPGPGETAPAEQRAARDG